MAQNQIKNLSPKHDAIMSWLLTNQDQPLSACAIHFGVTQPWLSIIIHSDIFQARYRELLQDHIDERIIPLRDKLVGVSHLALDRLAEKVPYMEAPEDLTEVVKTTTKALGMGPTAKISIEQHNTTINQRTALSPSELEEARRLYESHSRGLTIEGESTVIPDAAPSS